MAVFRDLWAVNGAFKKELIQFPARVYTRGHVKTLNGHAPMLIAGLFSRPFCTYSRAGRLGRSSRAGNSAHCAEAGPRVELLGVALDTSSKSRGPPLLLFVALLMNGAHCIKGENKLDALMTPARETIDAGQMRKKA